jgi:hypothetical protein
VKVKGKGRRKAKGPEPLGRLWALSLPKRLVARVKGTLLGAVEGREPAYFRLRQPQAIGNEPMGARTYPQDRPPALAQGSRTVVIVPPAVPQ